MRFRVADRDNFAEIREGLKTVETRAATERYRDLSAGDVLIFVCGRDKIERTVKRVRYFKTIDKMLSSISLGRIMPSVFSKIEAKKIYYTYPNYREKIRKFGLMAFDI